MSEIAKEIFQGNLLTEAEYDLIDSKLIKISLRKGELLLQPGNRIDKIYYVHEGCLRSYLIDGDGKEHTLRFAIKGWWISDYIALYGNDNSGAVSYLECIQDAELYGVLKSDFDSLIQSIPKVAQMHTRKMELAFAGFQRRILENLTLTAKERYSKFIQRYPSISEGIKNYHLASYLGIATESLSRIRKELASK